MIMINKINACVTNTSSGIGSKSNVGEGTVIKLRKKRRIQREVVR